MRTGHDWFGWAAASFALAAEGGCLSLSAQRRPVASPDDLLYQPTPQDVVNEMLELAHIGARDVVYDLGSGDGRIVIAAVQRLGARGVCVDVDPERIRESKANAQCAGVAERIAFLEQDLFETDLRDATVVTLFLWPDVNLKLRAKLWRELAPGTRVVSYVHDMDDWAPQAMRDVQSIYGAQALYLWRIGEPAQRRATD
jgi:SAM-dependent methyltransferase